MHAHHLCCMCGVTRKRMWRQHISTQQLEQQLGLESMDTYISKRQLRWLGHVRRIDYERRLPRRMLSAWVPSRRPNGAPKMTYGRTVTKALDKFGVDVARWPELAANRPVWRTMLKTGLAPLEYRPPPSPPPAEPISRTRQMRSSIAATNAKIDASVQLERRPLADLNHRN